MTNMRKNNIKIIKVATLVFGFFAHVSSFATITQPKFTIIPTGSTIFSLQTGQVVTAQYQVTNQTKITRTLVLATGITGVSQLTSGSGYCGSTFTLAHGQSCLLTLQLNASQMPTGSTNTPIEVCKTGTNNAPDPFLCSRTAEANNLQITIATPARVSVVPRVLTLVPSGSAKSMTITNLSSTSTISNVQAVLAGTALSGYVTQNATACSTLAPLQSCNLIFTPGSTEVSITPVAIQGTNMQTTSAAIRVNSTAAELTVTGSPLVLTVGGGTGTLTVTNNSSTVTATNVRAILSPAVYLAVTQDSTDCATLLPGASCSLVFTGTSALQPTTIPIVGVGAATTSAVITVTAASNVNLSVSGSPLVLPANGYTTGSMTITNTSSTTAATNVQAIFTNTNLQGLVSASSCGTIQPSSSCTMTFTPGTTPTAQTSFLISGSNTNASTAQLALSPYFLYVTNVSSASVSLCNLLSSSGAITGQILGCSTALNLSAEPIAIAFNSAGTQSYTSVSSSALSPPTIVNCPVSSTTGTLGSPCTTITLNITSGGSTGGVVYNPTTGYVYTAAGGLIFQCTLNTDESLSSCNQAASGLTDQPANLALNPNGNLLYVANLESSSVSYCTISSTGSITGCLSSTVNGDSIGVAINAQNTYAYLSTNLTDLLQCVIGSGGALTSCNTTTFASSPVGLALMPALNSLYVGNTTGNDVSICTVSTSTGAVTGCSSAGASGFGLSTPFGVSLYPAS